MKSEVFDQVKKEMKHLAVIFAVSVIIFQIAFYKENLLTNIRIVFSLFWLFALPGYSLMLTWKKFGLIERFFIGITLAAAIEGIFSYYLGLLGLNIKYHTILFPAMLIVIGAWFGLFSKMAEEKSSQ